MGLEIGVRIELGIGLGMKLGMGTHNLNFSTITSAITVQMLIIKLILSSMPSPMTSLSPIRKSCTMCIPLRAQVSKRFTTDFNCIDKIFEKG